MLQVSHAGIRSGDCSGETIVGEIEPCQFSQVPDLIRKWTSDIVRVKIKCTLIGELPDR